MQSELLVAVSVASEVEFFGRTRSRIDMRAHAAASMVTHGGPERTFCRAGGSCECPGPLAWLVAVPAVQLIAESASTGILTGSPGVGRSDWPSAMGTSGARVARLPAEVKKDPGGRFGTLHRACFVQCLGRRRRQLGWFAVEQLRYPQPPVTRS